MLEHSPEQTTAPQRRISPWRDRAMTWAAGCAVLCLVGAVGAGPADAAPATVQGVPTTGWGSNAYGQLDPPADLGLVTGLAAGHNHNLAIRPDGTVVAWGQNDDGQATVPAGLDHVVQVEAGYFFSLALRSDGTIVGWGDPHASTPPAGLTGVVDIAAAGHGGEAVLRDGSVVGWGQNSYAVERPPAGLTDIASIDSGYDFTLALRRDGTVVAWGSDYRGDTTVPAGLDHVVAVSAGLYHALALKSDGTVVAWGYDASGQATVPAGLDHVVAIAAGSYFSTALKSDGTVVAWGDDYYGQSSVPAGLDDVVGIAAGGYHVAVLQRRAPTLTGDPSPGAATVGTPFSATYTATGLPTPGFSLTSGALPPGLVLNAATGSLSGTPTRAGTYSYAISADNGVSPAARGATHTLVVRSRPAFTAASPPTALTAGRSFSYRFTASGSPTPTFTISAGSAPPGLALDRVTGVLSGTPRAAGASTFTVTASNAAGSTRTAITLVVAAVPAVSSPSSPSTAAGGDTGAATTSAAATSSVSTAGAQPARLAFTGTEYFLPLLGVGAVLVLAGAVLLVTVRRRAR